GGDVEIWVENPVVGVGTGQAALHRGQILDVEMVASHTEFARLLAEHGVFGIAAGLLLFFMAWNNLRRARSVPAKATVAAAMAWAFLFMAGGGRGGGGAAVFFCCCLFPLLYPRAPPRAPPPRPPPAPAPP